MKNFYISLIVIAFCISSQSDCTIIGANNAVSRQTRAFFKRLTSASNKLRGFSVFEKGFVLENPLTSAAFDAFFPIKGDVVLNGGTLSLVNDLEFKNPFQIGVGTIHGNGYSLEFPRNISYLDFPSLYYLKLIVNLIESVDVGNDVYSVDWSYDDAFVAVGLRGAGGNSELKIYSFDGTNLSLVAQEDFSSNFLNSLRWHPSSDYLATAASSGTELKTWYFNRGNNSLTEIDSANISHARAVQFSPNGNYLLVGEQRENYLHLYPFSSGVLGTVVQGSLGGSDREVMNNSLSWHSDGAYCVVGLKRASAEEMRVFNFNGTALTQVSAKELNANVNAVGWRPNSDIIAVGLSSSAERIRLYRFNSSSNELSEISSARVGLVEQVFHVAWDAFGKYLAVTKHYASQGYEVEVYFFDEEKETLHLVSGYSSDAQKRAVSWSRDGNYLATGDTADKLYVFDFKALPFVFKDLKLYFGSEVRAHAEIRFKGDCVINGSGNILDLSSSATLVVEANSQLTLENIVVKGIRGTDIRCEDESSCLILRDVKWVQDEDFTFTAGGLCILNDVEMLGDYVFTYDSPQTCTIQTKSQLILDSGFTFSYDPSSPDPSIYFTDASSVLTLDGATLHAGQEGINLKRGKLRISRDSFVCGHKNTSLTIGSGTISEDCIVDILSGSELICMEGSIRYKNVSSESWRQKNMSVIRLNAGTGLYLHKSLSLGNGAIYFDETSFLYRHAGAKLDGRVHARGSFSYQYE